MRSIYLRIHWEHSMVHPLCDFETWWKKLRELLHIILIEIGIFRFGNQISYVFFYKLKDSINYYLHRKHGRFFKYK